jgi:hypothetical protein
MEDTPVMDRPFNKKKNADDADSPDTETSTEPSEQATLVVTAADVAAMYKFADNKTEEFKKLFAFVADLYSRQLQTPTQQPAAAAAAPKQPVIA